MSAPRAWSIGSSADGTGQRISSPSQRRKPARRFGLSGSTTSGTGERPSSDPHAFGAVPCRLLGAGSVAQSTGSSVGTPSPRVSSSVIEGGGSSNSSWRRYQNDSG